MNKTKKKGCKSSYIGVCWIILKEMWQARVSKNGVRYSVGYFDNEFDAALARDKKAKELHGEFAHLNFTVT